MFTRITLSSLRKPLMLTAIAAGLMTSVTNARAGDYFNDPKAGKSESVYQPIPLDDNATTPTARPAPAGKLSIEQVGQLLDTYYPGKNTITNNGETYYTVNVQKGTWKFHLIVSLSPNGNVLWLTAPLVSMQDSARASAPALMDLLKKNTDLGPMFFQITNRQMVQMTEPVANHTLSAESFQANLEEFMKAIRTTEPLWKAEVLMPGAAAPSEQPAERPSADAIPAAPAPAASAPATPARNPLARNPLAR